MSKEDIARVALGAPALHEVFIVSRPDCLLVRSWARSGRQNAEEAAVQIGNVFRVAKEILEVMGSSQQPNTITVEADDKIVLLQNVSADMTAGFVFDKTAPLGLVRVQARQLSDHIRSSVNQLQDPAEASFGFGTPRSEEPAAPLATHRPGPAADPAPPPVRRIPEPAITVSVPPPPVVSHRPSRPRAARLLDFYKRYVPDAHAGLLRLSLRTGLSLEQLDHAEALDEEQVEQIAAAVREILGQEQIGI